MVAAGVRGLLAVRAFTNQQEIDQYTTHDGLADFFSIDLSLDL